MLRMASLLLMFPLACSPMKVVNIPSISVLDQSSPSPTKHKCHINWEKPMLTKGGIRTSMAILRTTKSYRHYLLSLFKKSLKFLAKSICCVTF
jgi:hypothetical protein